MIYTMINSIITIFLYVNTSWMWMSQQIIPSYREKNCVCATNRSPEVFNAQLLDQNVAMHSICQVPNPVRTHKKHKKLSQTTTLHGWIGRDLNFTTKRSNQKSKSAVVQGLEGISTSTVTGGPGGPGEGLRVGLRLGSLELRRQRQGALYKYGGGPIKRGNPVWKMDQNGTKFG
jgi:hypothetical protein